jgi:hypothetical protein
MASLHEMRTLMVGCAAGEGHLDGAEQLHRASAQILAADRSRDRLPADRWSVLMASSAAVLRFTSRRKARAAADGP